MTETATNLYRAPVAYFAPNKPKRWSRPHPAQVEARCGSRCPYCGLSGSPKIIGELAALANLTEMRSSFTEPCESATHPALYSGQLGHRGATDHGGIVVVSRLDDVFPVLQSRTRGRLNRKIDPVRRELWRAFQRGGLSEAEFGSTLDRLDEIGIHLMPPPSASVPDGA